MKKLLFTQLFVLIALVGFSQASKTMLGLGFSETSSMFIASVSDSVTATVGGGNLVIMAKNNPEYHVVSYWLNNGTKMDSVNFGATHKAYIQVVAYSTAPVILRIDLANEQAPGSLTSKDRAANTSPASTLALTTTPTTYSIGPVTVWKQAYVPGNNGTVDSTAINQIDIFMLPTVVGDTTWTGTLTIDSLYLSDSPIVAAVSNPNLVSGSTKLFPNPVSGTATLAYSLKEGSNVKLVLNDMTGRPIRTISEGYRNAGDINESINVSDLQQGMYNVSFIIDGASVKIEKMAVK